MNDNFSYSRLTEQDKAKIRKNVENIKAQSWFKDGNPEFIFSVYNDNYESGKVYYTAVVFPTSTITSVYGKGSTYIYNIKNTEKNIRPHIYFNGDTSDRKAYINIYQTYLKDNTTAQVEIKPKSGSYSAYISGTTLYPRDYNDGEYKPNFYGVKSVEEVYRYTLEQLGFDDRNPKKYKKTPQDYNDENIEYRYLTFSDRHMLKTYVDENIKKSSWYNDDIQMLSCYYADNYESGRYFNAFYFFLSNEATEVYNKTTKIKMAKNTEKNYRPFGYFKVDTSDRNRYIKIYSYYDKTTNTLTEIRPELKGNSTTSLSSSTLCPINDKEFKPNFPIDTMGEVYQFVNSYLKPKKQCGVEPKPPSNGGGGHPGGQNPTPVDYKLHLYVDNLTMGQLTLCRPQLEIGTVATDWKPNPNDTLNSVNETVKVINDKVTAIETKVGEIELQVKDNKTTITTIQSDVTKKITEQDNKIASIELKNNSITSTVEDVKNKTTELEGKVTDQAEQIKRVEQQITPEGIQSVVQDKITQAKNEAVQEANNSTDTKLEQYTLKDNFTKFKQDSEKFQLQVSQTGVTNILKNSRPRNFNKDFWYIGYNFHTMYRYFDGTDEATSHENFEGEVFKSGLWFTMWAPTVQNGWLFLANNSIRDYKFNLQKKYTIDFLLYSDNSHTNIYLQVADDNGANQVFYSGNIHLKNGYNRLTYTFTPKVEGNQPNFMIVVNNRNGESINMYVPWVNFYEGYPITKQHLPDGRGLVDSLTTIDKDGIKCNFGDGTWASMGRQGFAYYTQGMTNPYKYINFTTKLTGIRNGHWVAITLPPCFTRKNINTDFVVQAWAGAIDSNAFAKHQQDAVRNLFIEVGNWNNETRQLFVRPCLQKIGIATKTLFGWDQATTSRGNPIGEGTVDIIVLVQM